MIEELHLWLQQQIQHNDVFAGLVGGSAVASVIYALRSVPRQLWRLFLLQGTAHVLVYNDDEAFEWFNQWLSGHPYAKRTRRMKLSSFYRDGEDNSDVGGIRWALAPGPGAHLFWDKGRIVWLDRRVEEGEGAAGSHRRKETIEIRVLGRSSAPIRSLIEEARKLQTGGDRIDIYAYQGFWRRVARKLPRALETVVLPTRQVDSIISDATWFFGASEWYCQRGVPYRRGYLLYGPPGCGKTSLVMALASHFRRPIYTLNLGSIWSDDKLFQSLSEVPPAALLLIEDIDATTAPKARQRKPSRDERAPNEPQELSAVEENEGHGITLSGLLNAIDGVASTDGRLLIMTTNFPERLDQALIRPGRVDRQEHIGPLGTDDACRLFGRFFDDERALAAFADAYDGQARPGADLQGIFMTYCDDPWSAVAAVAGEAREAAE